MAKKFTPLAFILLWIVPVAWVGLMRSSYPLYPGWIAPLFRVSGVFETAPNRWRIFFIEVKDNQGWHYQDEKTLFASTPLGDRTRFQPLMNEIVAGQLQEAPRLLQWVAIHLPKRSLSRLEAVRIVHFGITADTFLKCHSFEDVYNSANQLKLQRRIVASMNFSDVNENR